MDGFNFIDLKSVYERPDHKELLLKLLGEREPHQNISHKAMPSWDEHCAFVDSKPYAAWYFIYRWDMVVGAIYLSRQNEIGVFVFRVYQGQEHGTAAIKKLMELHGKRRYLANVNPTNSRSAALFARLGFKLVQLTYESV